MKRFNYKYIVWAVVVMFASSCDSYLDVNENPNNPQDAPLSGLMTNVTYQSALNTYRLGSFTSYYVQYLASANPGSSTDTMDPLDYSTTWFNLYNVMTDLYVMVGKAEESGASNYLGVAQIMMALNMSMTVDIFGDVPFSEGFEFQTLTPVYDDDMVLYQQALEYLDQGIQNLQGESIYTIAEDDFIFEGDLDKWAAFGNMLKARLMIHQKGQAEYSAQEVLSAVENGFTSNEDNAQVFFFEQDFNPWAQVAIDNDNLLLGGWISEQFVQALDGTSYAMEDPRLSLMIGTTDEGEFVGTANGVGRGNAPEQGARSTLIEDQFYTSKQSPVLIGTYAEQKFIEAEAAFEADKARAYQAYIDGITSHMEMLEVPSDEMEAYLADPSVSMGEAAFTMEDIFKEKWVALFLHPESWNDARRFDYAYKGMTIPANLNPDLNGQFIRRLRYPDSEVSRNGQNIPEVTLLDRIFWDVE
ncbi:SusD/RagB family nutrient-binding outer membrane lipoprotein [Echinicola strongylocentroti]|uniref:SusD/RagB family nutrient-binding outer membrane lipoprotein n=1 Tax=Echinicola strongylocentroti TaxID=1795355 RepID=A0A2Z4IF75_9BACT|nr:SusD/RagB family nutrient-binding outer membrane lipoprotein [Echinicola strongylocentroti]AWW29326.1 SusD/RagB family nutrient-binding outer membrane lipoprotein [Echinicola strongylocentroti]